ncbi:sodium/hydrogen exchanger 9B2 isoform X2 [Anabrus simplex]
MNMDHHMHDPPTSGMGPLTPTSTLEPRRRVSIASDPVSEGRLHGYTNEGFEPRRRISVASDQVSDGRRKSILHNPDTVSMGSHHENGKPAFGDAVPMKKYSMTESVSEKPKYVPKSEVDKSWWFIFCRKCRQEETTNSWQPPLWQRLCPYPFCPSYRQFARLLALLLVGLLTWGIVYCIMGKEAGPGGQLFGLAFLSIAAHFGGWLITLTTLPALIGMLTVGILFQNVGLVEIEGEYVEVVAVLRRIALVIILTRAGLDLDPSALNRLRITVLKLGLGPWIVECVVVAVMTHFLMGLPWIWGLLLGSVIAAVSPAVVVPCLFRLRGKGYGVAKGIPTLIIAVSGIDDATSVAIFGIIHSVMFSTDSLAYQIIQGPLSIIGGVGFGVLWGFLAKYVPEKDDPFVVPLRILMLFGGGLIAVFGSETIGFGGAGPLGCVAAAFVSVYHWSQQGWEIEDNPVATAFEIFWMIFEPILFGITGTQIKINELEPHTVSIGLACLGAGVLIRILSTVGLAIGCKLNLKEKIFVAFSWMAKATVQAALGPVTLDSVREANNPQETQYAETVLMICVLSILVTAPLGAVLITVSGPRLLKKTTIPAIVEGWRRSARPSLRDISIIDEEEDGEGVAT